MGSARKSKAIRKAATKTDVPAVLSSNGWSWRAFAIAAAAIAGLTFIVYYRVLHHGFFQLDDGVYVTENPAVQGGLTMQGVRWAFTSFHCANWHPLTWISLMLDRQLYGLGPMGFHLTNLLFHVANSLLLLLVLSLMTRSLWKSAFVAVLFAIHPLHVESVAWISERKDVLSAFFWMLAMLAHWHYTRRPGFGRYALVLVLLALGLMSKPMLVSLPLMLLLMDWWPLQRRFSWNLVAEKVPLLLISAASSFITMIAQRHGGAVVEVRQLPVLVRASNAVSAYFQYLVYTVWPSGLSFFYTQIHQIPAVCVAVLILVSVAVVLLRRRHPYLAVGWLWYLITLVPVIGLVQVGGQLMADRYTYIPLIGIFIMIAWGIPDSMGMVKWSDGQMAETSSTGNHQPSTINHFSWLSVAAFAVVAILSACAFRQVSFWREDAILAEHAIKANPSNYVAHDILGMSLAKQDRLDEAISHYDAAIAADPNYAQAYNNMGIALRRLGRPGLAAEYLTKVLDMYPGYADAHANLGNCYHEMGRHTDELAEYLQALQANPDLHSVRINTSDALMELGRFDDAIAQINIVLSAIPNNPSARIRLAAALYGKMDYLAAWRQVHILRRFGSDAPPAFVNALSARMPEPAP